MKILILGGSEFIGKTFINDLLEKGETQVFMINRGKKYWNVLMKEVEGVKFYYGDRHEYKEFEKLITYISKKHGIGKDSKWDLVVDFSCFERKELKAVIIPLKGIC